MLVTYRFLLRPTSGQHERLSALLELQRQLYNAALEERIGAWRTSKVSVTKLDQQKSLTRIRRDDLDGHGSVPANMGRWTLKRLDDAYQAMFSRIGRKSKVGFPRFRSRERWRSFGLLEWSGAGIDGGFLRLKGMSRRLRVNWHRPLPDDAVIKGAIFTRHGKRWFVSLQIETTSIMSTKAQGDAVVGIDVGVEHLATWHDGANAEHVENPAIGKRHAADMRRAQRALSRCRRGSNRRRKIRRRLTRLQERIASTRNTHLHVQAERMARRFSTIVVEKLVLANMTRSAAGTVAEPGKNVAAKRGLNRAILDASMGRFVQLLRYKAERAGGVVLDVSARNTSQDCSGCGVKTPKPLSQRMHRCGSCGLVHQRDVNAARNIRARGLSAIAESRGVIAPGKPNVDHLVVRASGTLLAA